MTTEQLSTVRAALEHAGKLLTDAARAMEPKPNTPPVPPIPERYAGEFAHEEPPRYATPKRGEYFLWQNIDGEPLQTIDKALYDWTEDGESRRWILRKLPARPPMPGPANECWWCESQRKWITVEEEYGDPLSDIAVTANLAFTGEFRRLAEGDWYLGTTGKAYQAGKLDSNCTHPRLILRPVPPAPKPIELRFREYATGLFNGCIHWRCKDGSVRRFRIVEEQ